MTLVCKEALQVTIEGYGQRTGNWDPQELSQMRLSFFETFFRGGCCTAALSGAWSQGGVVNHLICSKVCDCPLSLNVNIFYHDLS